jgi:hypothetical protein
MSSPRAGKDLRRGVWKGDFWVFCSLYTLGSMADIPHGEFLRKFHYSSIAIDVCMKYVSWVTAHIYIL